MNKNVSVMEMDEKQENRGITHIRWETPLVDVYKVNWNAAIFWVYGVGSHNKGSQGIYDRHEKPKKAVEF
jgi:hypothetical protein